MLKQTLALVGLTLSLSTNAAILSLNSSFGADTITRDTDTGLDWLDVTETAGLTVNQVIAELGVDGIYEGWRYATVTEVDQLISNFGFIPNTPCTRTNITNCTSSESGDNPVFETMIRTLGDTYAKELSDRGYDFSTGAGDTVGYAFNDITPFSTYGAIIISDDEYIDYCVTAGCPRYVDRNDYIIINGATSAVYGGSFLVAPSSVPVPAAAWLFGSALIGLVSIKRKR